MINFDMLPMENEYYDGAAKKRAIKYNGSTYMVKYPAKTEQPNDLATVYSNSSFSEYISCQIINALHMPGVNAQETLLGESNGKIAVACKDFTTPFLRLVKFNMVQNADIDSDASGRHPVLQDVLQTYKTMPQLQNPAFIERFWDTFSIDALLGNFDRHAGNWGFLNDTQHGVLRLAPIYDCGSCLYPALSERHMTAVLSSQDEINKRIFDFPKSAFLDKTTKKKISYADALNDRSNIQLQKSLEKLSDCMDFDIISSVIDRTPYLSDTQKEFYNTMIQQRYEKLIQPALVKSVVYQNPIQSFCEKWAQQHTNPAELSDMDEETDMEVN